MTERLTYYSVVEICSGRKVYGGTSPQAATKALNNGRVIGEATAQAGATLNAQATARDIRRTRERNSNE